MRAAGARAGRLLIMAYSVFARKGEPDPFKPFGFQLELLNYMSTHTATRPARAMAVWPRRHGKDMTALFNVLSMAHDRVGMYWHGLPTYEQARKSCWNAFRNDTGRRLMDSVFPREIRRRPNEFTPSAEMLVELNNGSIIQFVGSDTIDSMVGAGPAGLNASEFALWRPSAYDLIRPMLRESRGWATFLTTPRGHNHAYKMFNRLKARGDKAFVSYKTIYTAGRYNRAEADEILEEERAEGMLEELLEQEYLCSWSAANVGSYWGDLINILEMAGALDDFTYDTDETYAVFDLGYGDSTAIWFFQITPYGVDVVAHYANHSKPMGHYFDLMDDWSRSYGFKYAKVFLPHDARAHSLQTGVTILEQTVQRFGTVRVEIVPKMDVLDGIQAARWLLQQNIRFHPRCEAHDGMEALRQYHRKYDEDKRAFALHPDHDWSSHSADAFRYMATVIKLTQLYKRLAETKIARAAPKRVITPTSGATLGTVDEIFKEMAAANKRRRQTWDM